MSRVQKGMVAGFAATVAVSLIEAVNLFAGPWVEPFPLFLAALIGQPDNLMLGWGLHLVAGTVVLGGLFGLLYQRLPGATPESRGIIFAVGAWSALMVAVFLFGSYRTFSGTGGFGLVGWMLVSHAVFGIVLGNVHARLLGREKRAMRSLAGTMPAH
ncbi:DUF6789 family protein [Brevundimonas sp. LM2]|uniref:DUF6789 family protein n=1 Tax=Brevundimonas sp. LM2 TaxID=1938605 RepID=UPI00209A7E88|nr:DUF6789 family protein [Brevundimonas sp. LM2]